MVEEQSYRPSSPEQTPGQRPIDVGLIGVIQDDLYDLRKWPAARKTQEARGDIEAEKVLRRYSAEELLQRIRSQQNEPGVAEFVQSMFGKASSDEDRYLIAETAYVILDAAKTSLDAES